jgi:hypothetical protein
MIMLPWGAFPSPHGHGPATEIVAAIYMVSWLLLAPGSPAMHVCFPIGRRPGQIHSTGSMAISEAQTETRHGWLPLPLVKG